MAHDYDRWNRFGELFAQGRSKRSVLNTIWSFGLTVTGNTTLKEWEAEKSGIWYCQRILQPLLTAAWGYSDYTTPEQNFPVSRPHQPWWELCAWPPMITGFHHDNNWKTPYENYHLCRCNLNGSNLLLNMGPKEDGTIPEEANPCPEELGAWNKRNGGCFFNTVGGIPSKTILRTHHLIQRFDFTVSVYSW